MKSSKYKYVSRQRAGHKRNKPWQVQVPIKFGGTHCRLFETEREAARYADEFLIKQGLEPVNVLKKV